MDRNEKCTGLEFNKVDLSDTQEQSMVHKSKNTTEHRKKNRKYRKIREILWKGWVGTQFDSREKCPNFRESVPISGKVSRIPGKMSSDFFSANIEIVLQDGNIVALRTDQGTAFVALA